MLFLGQRKKEQMSLGVWPAERGGHSEGLSAANSAGMLGGKQGSLQKAMPKLSYFFIL